MINFVSCLIGQKRNPIPSMSQTEQCPAAHLPRLRNKDFTSNTRIQDNTAAKEVEPRQAGRDEVNSERCSIEAGFEHCRSTKPRRPPLRYGCECVDLS